MSIVYEDMGTQKARGIAKQYKSQHGELVRVVCSPSPKTIRLIYADGTELLGKCDDGYFMQFGYMGSGTSNFWAFLNENAFKISYDDLIQMCTPEAITPEATQLSPRHIVNVERQKRRWEEEEKQRKEEEKRRQAEETKRKAEYERRAAVQSKRKLSGQCIMCGLKLSFLQKLSRKDKHNRCTVFTD